MGRICTWEDDGSEKGTSVERTGSWVHFSNDSYKIHVSQVGRQVRRVHTLVSSGHRTPWPHGPGTLALCSAHFQAVLISAHDTQLVLFFCSWSMALYSLFFVEVFVTICGDLTKHSAQLLTGAYHGSQVFWRHQWCFCSMFLRVLLGISAGFSAWTW